MRDIVFWGATGHSKVLHEALLDTPFRLIALIDNRRLNSPIHGVPLYIGDPGFDELVSHYDTPSKLFFCIAIGGACGVDRLMLFEKLCKRGLTPWTLVHRTAFVARDARIGQGCQILAQSAVCSSVTLGRAVIINTSASVDHDCVIGEGAHIGPGAHLAGEVEVGNRAFIATGAVVLPRVHIGADSIVGAGAVVVDDVLPNSTVVGNPARRIKARANGL